MKQFRAFITEGGNVKIAGQGADPIKVTPKNREAVQGDVDTALRHIHSSFHAATGHHLFGAGHEALKTKSAYSGSTKHLMNNEISHKEFTQHKPTVGDIDVQIPHEHMDALSKHLIPGSKFGKYTVAGVQAHGAERSAIMKHESGQHHQFDFEGVKYEKHEPTKHEQFLHSSDWGDTKAGIKGIHHKILLNAAGGGKYKFSTTHGVKLRSDETKNPGEKEPTKVSQTLFGQKADHSKIHSFQGVADLVKQHVPKEQHQAVYDKFKESAAAKKKIDSGNALSHLKKTLKVKDSVSEEVKQGDDIEIVDYHPYTGARAKVTTVHKDGAQVNINGVGNYRIPHKNLKKLDESEEYHHTSVIPLVGFSPISHMGHAADLGAALGKLPGKKHVGISKKADLFSSEERNSIMKKQWGSHVDAEHHSAVSAGEVVAKAHASLPEGGKKHLHLLVGADRADMAHKLAASIKAGKIKELGGKTFDKITVHHPEDMERTHGLSGTNMRTAAASGDVHTFSKHLGPMFDKHETLNIMKKVKTGLDSGQIKVKR